MRVAVIGTGIAGLGAAHALARVHDVEVFERDGARRRPRQHGHRCSGPTAASLRSTPASWSTTSATTRGCRASSASSAWRVQDSEMSLLGRAARAAGLEYSAVRLWSQPRTLCARAWRGCWPRSCASCAPASGRSSERYARSTLGELRARPRATRGAFRDHFLVPFASALWSTAPAQTLDFPVVLRRALLPEPRPARLSPRTGGAPSSAAAAATWRRCTGPLGARLRLGADVRAVARDADGVEVRTADDEAHRFDARGHRDPRAPGARHAGRRRRATSAPCSGAFATTLNDTVLHTDERLLPRATARARSVELPGRRLPRAVDGAHRDLLPEQAPAPRRARALLRHAEPRRPHRRGPRDPPLRLRATRSTPSTRCAAQARLPTLDGRRRTWFCGAYQGFGFHEDGLASGLRAARRARGAAGEVGALRGHAHARAHRAGAQRLPLPGLLLRLDLDELPELDRRLAPVRLQPPRTSSRSATATTSATPRGRSRRTSSRFLAERGIDLAGGRIVLLTNLRLLGYVFNPVSYFYCYGAGGELAAIVAEVGNTFGERHPYLLTSANQVRGRRPAASTSTPSCCTSRRSSAWTRPTASRSPSPASGSTRGSASSRAGSARSGPS